MRTNEKMLVDKLNIPIINKDRRYWLVRTDSGTLWEQFKSEDFIGINWNEFSDIELLEKCKVDKNVEAEIKKEIQQIYDVEHGGRILNQINRFVFDLNIGDIVMIPSQNSSIISFGEVASDVYKYELTDEDIDNEYCDFIKRRDIKWLKDISKKDLDPMLFKMLQAHQTISNADSYAHEIDRALELLYIKDEKIHLTIMVKAQGEIKGKDLYALQKLVYDCIGVDEESLDMKINVQSPGPIEFITNNIWDIVKILFVVNIIIGGGKGLGFEIPGILHWYHTLNQAKKQNDIEERKMKLEENKFEYEKEKDKYDVLIKEFKDNLDRLELELPNNISNININDEMVITDDEEN